MISKNYKLICLLAVLIVVVTSVAHAFTYETKTNTVTQTIKDTSWLDGWDKRVKITIDHSDVNENFTNFPILVYLGSSAGRNKDNVTFIFDELQNVANRKKIAVTTKDNTQCYVEIEKYNQTNKQAWLWVKVPNISSVEDTVLYLYYGRTQADNNNYVGDTGSAAAKQVWDSNFKAVLHLNQTPSGQAGEIKDSTSYANNGTTQGSMNSTDLVDAKIGSGLEFDEIDDLIRVPNSTSLSFSKGSGTCELWINWANASDGDHQIVMTSSNRFTGTPQDGFEWASQGNGNHFFYPWAGNGNDYNLGPNPFTNGVWHHLVVTYLYATKEVKIYIDAINMSFSTTWVPTFWTQLANTSDWLWGGNPDRPTRYFDGKFDEIRIHSEAKSTAWIKASYESGRDDLIDLGIQDMQNRYSLDALGGFMIVGDGTPNWGSSAGTISFWVNWDTVGNRPWGQHDNMELRFSGSYLVVDWGASGSLTSNTAFNAGKWYFIAIVWNENLDRLYLYVGDQNNAPVVDAQNNSWTLSVSTVGVTQNNFLASRGGVNPTDGRGDDLRYWNVDRSLAAIQNDYITEITGLQTNLRSYFRLNNNFYDSGPNNNNGASSGSYSFSTSVPFC